MAAVKNIATYTTNEEKIAHLQSEVAEVKGRLRARLMQSYGNSSQEEMVNLVMRLLAGVYHISATAAE